MASVILDLDLYLRGEGESCTEAVQQLADALEHVAGLLTSERSVEGLSEAGEFRERLYLPDGQRLGSFTARERVERLGG